MNIAGLFFIAAAIVALVAALLLTLGGDRDAKGNEKHWKEDLTWRSQREDRLKWLALQLLDHQGRHQRSDCDQEN